MARGARNKGLIKNVDTGEIKYFDYNPSEYNESKAVKFNEIESPGTSTPKFEYVGGKAREISFQLFFHRHDPKYIEDFMEFMEQFIPEKHSQYDPPPKVFLAYGNVVGKYIMKGLNKRVITVNKDLRPIEATLDVVLKEV